MTKSRLLVNSSIMWAYLPSLTLAAYPAIFQYGRYSDQVGLRELLSALACSILAATLVALLASISFRHSKYVDDNPGYLAAIVTTCAIAIAITYGHLYNTTTYWQDVLTRTGLATPITESIHHIALLSFCALLLKWIINRLTITSKQSLHAMARLSVVFSITLLAVPVAQLVSSSRNPSSEIPSMTMKDFDTAIKVHCTYCQSDIYHIVLDGYARSDTLRQHYGFDNARFENKLRSLGFNVIEDARANYFWTFLSLASTLNMTYLAEPDFDPDMRSRAHAHRMIESNSVIATLKQFGYSYVHINSTYRPTMRNRNADHTFNCRAGVVQNDYYRVLLEGSILRVLNSQASEDLANCHLENLNWLKEEAPRVEGRKYVFSHFIPPHHPYLFDELGNVQHHATLSDQFDFQSKQWADRNGYLNQLVFITNQIEEVVQVILEKSDTPPFIILHSDHGPQLLDTSGRQSAHYNDGRSAIFLAILTPDRNTNIPVKTPVNLFRFILAEYFSLDYPLLEDRTYRSEYEAPFSLRPIVNEDAAKTSH